MVGKTVEGQQIEVFWQPDGLEAVPEDTLQWGPTVLRLESKGHHLAASL